MSDDEARFLAERQENIAAQGADSDLKGLAHIFARCTARYKYSYNFEWLGRPIIQFPQDIVAMQELIWRIRPSLIVETGVARGGSTIFYASMLEMLGQPGKIVGIDIDIRSHNRSAIEAHPLSHRVELVEGSSIEASTVERVFALARGHERVIVTLDSNHTHEHVLQELRLYSPLVKSGSYLVVFDTLIEDMPADGFPDRPWGKGNNPKTAVRAFLKETDRFVVDQEMEAKLMLTVAPEGYLRCLRD